MANSGKAETKRAQAPVYFGVQLAGQHIQHSADAGFSGLFCGQGHGGNIGRKYRFAKIAFAMIVHAI